MSCSFAGVKIERGDTCSEWGCFREKSSLTVENIPRRPYAEQGVLNCYPISDSTKEKLRGIFSGDKYLTAVVQNLIGNSDALLSTATQTLLLHSRKIVRMPFGRGMPSEKRNTDEDHSIAIAEIAIELLQPIISSGTQGEDINTAQPFWKSKNLIPVIALLHDALGEALGEIGHNGHLQQEKSPAISKHSFESRVAQLAILAVITVVKEAARITLPREHEVTGENLVNRYSWLINLCRVDSRQFIRHSLAQQLWLSYEPLTPDLNRSGKYNRPVQKNRSRLLDADQISKVLNRVLGISHSERYVPISEKILADPLAKQLYGYHLIEGGEINTFCTLFPECSFSADEKQRLSLISWGIKAIDHSEGTLYKLEVLSSMEDSYKELELLEKDISKPKNNGSPCIKPFRNEVAISAKDLFKLVTLVQDLPDGRSFEGAELDAIKNVAQFIIGTIEHSCDFYAKFKGKTWDFKNEAEALKSLCQALKSDFNALTSLDKNSPILSKLTQDHLLPSAS